MKALDYAHRHLTQLILPRPDPWRPAASARCAFAVARKVSWKLSLSFIPSAGPETLCNPADAALPQVGRSNPEATPYPQGTQWPSFRGSASQC